MVDQERCRHPDRLNNMKCKRKLVMSGRATDSRETRTRRRGPVSIKWLMNSIQGAVHVSISSGGDANHATNVLIGGGSSQPTQDESTRTCTILTSLPCAVSCWEIATIPDTPKGGGGIWSQDNRRLDSCGCWHLVVCCERRVWRVWESRVGESVVVCDNPCTYQC